MEVAPERGRNARTETLRVRGVERYAAGDLLAAAALWREALTQAPDDIQAQAYVAWIESRLAMEAQVPGTTRSAGAVHASVFSAETVDPIGELASAPSGGPPEGTIGRGPPPRAGAVPDETTGAGGFDGVEAPVRRFLAHTPTRPNLVPLDDVPVLSEEKVAELAALQQGGRPTAANGRRRTLPPQAPPAGTAVPSPSETPTRVVAPDPATVAQLAAPSSPATIVMPAPAMPAAAVPPAAPAGAAAPASSMPPAVAAPAPPQRGPVPSPFRAAPPSSSPGLRSPTPSPFARPPEILSPARTTSPGTAVRPPDPSSNPSTGDRTPSPPPSTSTIRGAAPRRKPVTVEMEAEPEDKAAPRPPAPAPPTPRRPTGPVARAEDPPRRPTGPVARPDDSQATPRPPRDEPPARRSTAPFPFAERTLAARLAYDRADIDSAVTIAEEVVAAAGGLDAEVLAEHASKLLMIYEKVLGRRERLVRLGDLPPALDPRAAFVLSRVDGSFSVDDLIDVSGMDRAQAFRLVALMLRSGALVAG